MGCCLPKPVYRTRHQVIYIQEYMPPLLPLPSAPLPSAPLPSAPLPSAPPPIRIPSAPVPSAPYEPYYSSSYNISV